MAEELYDVAILGGGPGGYTAALYCARAGLSTIIVEKFTPGGQMSTTSNIENYPGFVPGVDGYELAEKMKQGVERFGVQTLFADVTAAELTCQPKTLITARETLQARAVIVATGASPRLLGVPEEEALRGRGVAYCATCDGMLYRGKTVAVVGGGNSAAEDAIFLSGICKQVFVIHRRDSLRASHSYLATLQQKENVSFIWNTRVSAFAHDKRITGLQLENVQTGAASALACDGVFIAVGRVPNTALFRDILETDGSGYLVADETTCTRVPGVFAAGDVRTKPLRQIITAAADGAVASKYAEEYISQL